MPPVQHHGAEADGRLGRALDFGLLKRLWVYLRPHQRWMWRGFIYLLIGSALRLLGPYLIKTLIDQNLTPRTLDGFYPLLSVFMVVVVGEALLRRLQMVAVDTAGQNALLDLRLALFRKLQQLPVSYFDRTSTGRLIGRVTTDVEALNEMFATGVVTILGDFLFLSATLVILFNLDWRLTLVSLIVVPILLFVTTLIRLRVRKAYIAMRARLSQMNAYLHEQISGMSVVQQFNRQAKMVGGYQEINGGVRDAQLASVRWETGLSTAVELLSSFTVALILWYGGGLVVETQLGANTTADSALTLGVLFAFVDYMQKFFHPLNELSLKYTVLQNAMTASHRIFGLLDADDHLPVPEQPNRPRQVSGEITFENVSFGYDPKFPVLKNVNFDVKPGQKVALVGATGAGKSTVLKLLTRLYDVTGGRILLDGIDIRELDPTDLRRHIGLVPQDVFLFEGDILENIRLGKPEVSTADVQEAARRLHLDRMVERFASGWEEPVLERGRNLSAGEKQLLSFARVMVASPSVLVLDEATSNVDSNTEKVLQEAVHELMEGRTSIAIAHRLSTVRDVDSILVFHKGEIVEQGSHEELLQADGVYARLVRLQYGSQTMDS
ncbi:MAG: ABC transporter ATP-binding protein [Planctomycetes bacterium]|nr:ABC transporter ATP-binding protein [Planctomycetota bacterium]